MVEWLAFSILAASMLTGKAVALENERTAIITDTAGEKTEVRNLQFFEGISSTSDLCVDTGVLVVIVHNAQLVSMSQIDKQKVSISYDYLGRRLVAEGVLPQSEDDSLEAVLDTAWRNCHEQAYPSSAHA